VNEQEFRAIADAHRRELLAHCYRILGSVHDAEDALQEALVRAWRALPAFEGRSTTRRWLYTIATRTSIDVASRRRTLPLYAVAPADPNAPPPPPGETPWLEPIADELLADDAPGPEAQISTRESVAFAFLTVLQTLPPRQRAALILRDVVGYSANETAEILELSVAATNSALQRARETIAAQKTVPADPRPDPGVLARFVTACETRDVDALVALLTRDAAFSMPPLPLWLQGVDAIRTFVRGTLFAMPGMREQRFVPAAANGLPAFVIYARDEQGVERPTALDVLVVRDGRIAEIHAFVGIDVTPFVRA